MIRSALIAVALLIALPLARPLIPFVFGAGYRPSVGIFVALLGVAMIDVLAAPILMLAYTADRPKLIAASDALRVLVLVLVAVLLIPILGAYGLVVARLAASLAGLIVTAVVLGRQLRSSDALASLVAEQDVAV